MRRLNRPLRAGALLALVLVLAVATACRPFWRRGERPPFRKVRPAVAYEIVRDTPDILILDLRRAEEFQGETGHVAGAQNIPLERLPYRLLQISSYREETFLVYCRGADNCGPDGMAVLIASGFEDAILIDGGIDEWIRTGFKTVLTVDDPGRPTGPREPAYRETSPPP
jgi:rhodanese-related sulfurtransferase